MTDIFKIWMHTPDYIQHLTSGNSQLVKGVSKSANRSETTTLSAIWKKERPQAICGGKKGSKFCPG